jgi:hypothetical protein
LGVDTCKPLGSVSVNPMPLNELALSEFEALGLLSVKLRVVGLFTKMVDAPKFLLIFGGPVTFRSAVLLAAPLPLSVDETGPVVFARSPALVPFTFTPTVQLLFAARIACLSEITPVPAVAVTAPLLQVSVTPGVAATTMPAGRLSVKDTLLSVTVLLAGLVTVNVTVEVPLSAMLFTPNALEMVGGFSAVRIAVLLAVPVPPFVELIAPVILLNEPAAVGVTFATIVQLLFVLTLPPASVIVPDPATAVAVPPQLSTKPFGVATTKFVGSVSVKATPFSASGLAAGFVIVKVSAVFPFTAVPVGLNALLIVGGAITSSVTVLLVVPVPPSFEVIAPVVLLHAPAGPPVTVTLNVQEPPAGIVPPESVTD